MKFEYSAGAFIYAKEKGKTLVLFLKREEEYDIPKGHIEKGESAEVSARREVEEEAGIDVPFLPCFVGQTKYFFREGGDKILKTVKFFLGEAKTKEVRISLEHTGYEWLDYNEAMKKIKYRDLKEILPRVFEYIEKCEEMKTLNNEYSKLPEKFTGWGLSRRLVPGEGPLDAGTVMVGEAPGAREDERRRPFVGRSGEILDRILRKARLRRNAFYITSVVQFRPPENRKPTNKEIAACKRFLIKQMEIIKPKNVILLGRTASSALLGIDRIEENHGKVIEEDNIRYIITFHPAAALRSKTAFESMTEDFKKIKTLISEK